MEGVHKGSSQQKQSGSSRLERVTRVQSNSFKHQEAPCPESPIFRHICSSTQNTTALSSGEPDLFLRGKGGVEALVLSHIAKDLGEQIKVL